MKNNCPPRAELLNSIPPSRYRSHLQNREPPKKGDVVTLDQGFTGLDGQAMALVYLIDASGSCIYEAEVYESELGPYL